MERKSKNPMVTCFGIFLVLITACYIYLFYNLTKLEGSIRDKNASLLSDQHDVLSVATGVGEDTIKWEWDVVHIVNTRFMQNQADFPVLAEARILLFKTFCLPTMINQTSQKFLWLIKVDPNLERKVKLKLVELLRPYPNFYLIGSNTNFLSGDHSPPGAWRGGLEADEVLSNNIYCGDLELLRGAKAAEDTKIVLETRLDADDGLNIKFVEEIQKSANHHLRKKREVDVDEIAQKRVKWRYWCIQSHIRWYAEADKHGSYDRGAVNPVDHEYFCVTPGLTVGFAVGTEYNAVMQKSHDILFKSVWNQGDCGVGRGKNCIEMMSRIGIGAIRTRTPTSAGMMHIVPEYQISRKQSDNLWGTLLRHFFITENEAKATNNFVNSNINKIALENAKGQCTRGHSCKLSSKETLLRLSEVDKYQKILKKIV